MKDANYDLACRTIAPLEIEGGINLKDSFFIISCGERVAFHIRANKKIYVERMYYKRSNIWLLGAMRNLVISQFCIKIRKIFLLRFLIRQLFLV